MEQWKSSVRAKVEHMLFYIKQMFSYEKTRYRGLAKNENRLALLLGCANLLSAEPVWSDARRIAVSDGSKPDKDPIISQGFELLLATVERAYLASHNIKPSITPLCQLIHRCLNGNLDSFCWIFLGHRICWNFSLFI